MGLERRPRHGAATTARTRDSRRAVAATSRTTAGSSRQGTMSARNCDSTRRGLVLPVTDQRARLGVGEHDPDKVAVFDIELEHGGEQQRERLVPATKSQRAPSRYAGAGASESRSRTTAGDGDGRAGPDRSALRMAGKRDEMVALHVVELQRPAPARRARRRRLDRPALFEPGVPTHRHIGEQRNLLATQARWCGGVGPRASRRRLA